MLMAGGSSLFGAVVGGAGGSVFNAASSVFKTVASHVVGGEEESGAGTGGERGRQRQLPQAGGVGSASALHALKQQLVEALQVGLHAHTQHSLSCLTFVCVVCLLYFLGQQVWISLSMGVHELEKNPCWGRAGLETGCLRIPRSSVLIRRALLVCNASATLLTNTPLLPANTVVV